MRAYRVYRVDGAGGFEAADWIEAESDEAALQLAGEMTGGGRCEVWERGRIVGAIRPRTRQQQTKLS